MLDRIREIASRDPKKRESVTLDERWFLPGKSQKSYEMKSGWTIDTRSHPRQKRMKGNVW
jgi:hypothetical protein